MQREVVVMEGRIVQKAALLKIVSDRIIKHSVKNGWVEYFIYVYFI